MEELMIRAHCARLVTTGDEYVCEPNPGLMKFCDKFEEDLRKLYVPPAEGYVPDPDVTEQIELDNKIEKEIRKHCEEIGPPSQAFINKIHWDIMGPFIERRRIERLCKEVE